MNLLIDAWIPVRLQEGGIPQKITLQTLLCEQQKWVLSLPRDDMELAALQLLICLVQVMWIPKNDNELCERIQHVLSEATFINGIKDREETFRLDHPDMPFMQVKHVDAKDATRMDKLLAGLTGATNCTFINEPGQGDALCGGCTSIALFNQANNVPGFGGGFKSGLRGGSPVTTLIYCGDLRSTIWINILTQPRLEALLPEGLHLEQPPTWQSAISSGETIPAASIGLVRGLFWQPAHIKLCPPIDGGKCTGCGQYSPLRYIGFLKAKFNFTVTELWSHPHSPRLLQIKKGELEQKFLAFTTAIPSWTQLSRVLVDKQLEKSSEGHRVAAVVAQIGEVFPGNKLRLIIGGYRNNQASILERRHDIFSFNRGWHSYGSILNEIIEAGLNYKTALRKALYTFSEGVKNSEIKGAGVAVYENAERQYFRQSEMLIPDLLASLDFEHADQTIEQLKFDLHRLCEHLFNEFTEPYSHHPKLVLSMAVARRSLYKNLSELQLQGGN